MATGILGIALTGLAAAQAGISTTQHNIANVNTDGYRRQEVGYQALTPAYVGNAFFGSGVGVSTVRSLYSQFQDSQVLLNQTQLSRSESYATQASQVDQLLSDSSSGLTTALDAFFSAAQTVASDPTSDAARQVMLSSGRNLTTRFNNLSTSLSDMRVDSNREISATVGSINTYSSQIATLSGNIAAAEASTGQPANDLRDQRDLLVANLNELINVTTFEQTDGTFNVYIGSGQPLVVGASVTPMTVVSDPNSPEFSVPALSLAGGVTQTLDSSLVSGGSLGGLMAVREEILQPAIQALDLMALAFATEFNALHEAGFDLNGTAGIAFFTDSATLSQNLQPAAQTGNTGSLTFSATLDDVTQLQASDYQLSFDGVNYTLTRLSDGVSASDPSLAAVTTLGGVAQGFTLTAAAGVPDAGDSWIIRPSHGAAGLITLNAAMTDPDQIAASSSNAGSPGNNENALLLTDLQTSATAIGGSQSFSSAYAQLVARTATLAYEADIAVSAYSAMTSQSIQLQQSVSGVNLDEEAANLIRFQQAYQASARAMQIASSLFDELIGLLR
jgi:flagellar hook-associated protein 1 FlgK